MKQSLRIPYLLYSYLSTEMLAPFFASFIILNGIFFLVKLIPFLNFALELSISFSDFIRLFSYMFPNMFLYTLPMASMMGIIIGFSRLASDTEILALKASGISMYHKLPPVILIAFFIAILTSYFSIKLIPVSEIAMKQLTYQLLKEKVDKGIQEYTFTEALGDLVVHVGKIDKTTGEWQKVWVSDMRGQIKPTITMAATGKMETDLKSMNITITLGKGSLHRPDEIDAQIINFDTYVINIPLRPPTAGVTSVHRGKLTMSQLQEAADRYGRDTERGRVMLVEYHERLVLPIGCLILTLLGLPLGLQAGPGKRAIGIPLGLAIFILYYALFTMTKMVAKEGNGSVMLLLWTPNLFFLVLALYCIRQTGDEKPLIPESIQYRFRNGFSYCLSIIKNLYYQLRERVLPLLPRPSRDIIIRRKTSSPHLLLRGDVRSHLYHFPECSDYNNEHCSIEFKNVQIAEMGGYQPLRILPFFKRPIQRCIVLKSPDLFHFPLALALYST